jgi:hypothetical protein
VRTTESIPVGSRWVHKGGAHVTVVSSDPFEVRSMIGLQECTELRVRREVFLREHTRAYDMKVICGRWGGVGEEWTVTVGFRLVAPYSLTPNAVLRVTAFEYRDSEMHVRLDCEDASGRGLAGLIRADFIFDRYRPAPPESRWLDPASVPVGEPMRVCSKDCPFPSRNSSGPGALCAYCASKDYLVAPRVLPSALSPAPRGGRPGAARLKRWGVRFVL